MKYIVNFSGGWCSFWAAWRTIDRHGPANTVLLFADVLIEHADLYSFNETAARILGVPITRISVGKSPWQLFREEGLIGNTRSPICSIRLKREPLNEWMGAHYMLHRHQSDVFLEDATVVLGFDWTEFHRVTEFQDIHPHWRVSSPMVNEPLWNKCDMQREGEKLGLKTPTLYKLGFPHNNCGGACVKAGISQFVHLYKVLPATFQEWEREELLTIEEFKRRGIEIYTVLRDRRGGTTKPLRLHDLRLRIEAGEEFDKHDWGGCGCGS